MTDLSFDKQWTRKRISAHTKQMAKRERMEAALARYVADAQAKIDIEREAEYQLLRDRNASEANFERRWGHEAWYALAGKIRRY